MVRSHDYRSVIGFHIVAVVGYIPLRRRIRLIKVIKADAGDGDSGHRSVEVDINPLRIVRGIHIILPFLHSHFGVIIHVLQGVARRE